MSVKRYDFDCYAFYDSARLTTNECEDGDYVRHSDYAALEAKYNALREAVHKAMDRTADCDKKQTNEQLIADVAYLKRLLVVARAEVDRLLMEASNNGHS